MGHFYLSKNDQCRYGLDGAGALFCISKRMTKIDVGFAYLGGSFRVRLLVMQSAVILPGLKPGRREDVRGEGRGALKLGSLSE